MRTFILLIFLLAVISASSQNVIYVDSSAFGGQDGTSWIDAFTSLQDAFAASMTRDTIKIAEGTYYPDEGGGQTDNDRNARITINDSLVAIGGYSSGGGIYSPNQFPVILSGEIQQDANNSNNSRGWFNLQDSSELKLFGVILEETKSTSRPTIEARNCNLELVGCRFHNNDNNYNGVVDVDGGHLKMVNCLITKNKALFGAILNSFNANCRIINCSLDSNSITDYGVLSSRNSSTVILNTSFKGNHTFSLGVVYAAGTELVRIENCIFNHNTISSGGSIFGINANLEVDRCLFHGNSAREGAGLYLGRNTQCDLTNSIFYNNTTTNAGTDVFMDRQHDSIRIDHCNFINAQGPISVKSRKYQDWTIHNSIFWGNQDDVYIRVFPTMIVNCILSEWFYNDENFECDPMFVDPQNLNFSLQDCSKGINNGIAVSDVSLDYYGNQRTYDYASDIGAIERQDSFNNLLSLTVDILDYPGCSNFGSAEVDYEGAGTIFIQINDLDQELPLDSLSVGTRILSLSNENCTLIDTFEVIHDPLPTAFYVDSSATGLNDGCSWVNAFNHLQDALSYLSPYDTLFIAEGTYYPDEGTTVMNGDTNASIVLEIPMTIIGGFPSGGGMRDFNMYQTIIDGNIMQDTFKYHRTRQLLRVESDSVHINGLVFKKGFTTIGNNTAPITLLGSETRLTNCIITNNCGIYGGAVYAENVTFFENCTFSRNEGLLGGAVFTNFGRSAFESCLFEFNHSVLSGGAVYANKPSLVILENCIAHNNVSQYYGGAYYIRRGANGEIINNTIYSNYAIEGGAVYSYFGSRCKIDNSIIWENSLPELETERNIPSNFISVRSAVIQNYLDGSNIISKDPQFIDAENFDFRVSKCSPAINTGDSSFVNTDEDFMGNLRLIDGTVDRGAYELQQLVPDRNSKHYVDLEAFGNNDGGSWDDAFTSLSECLSCHYVKDTVFVAEGIYKPSDSDRRASFRIPHGVQLFGGFSNITYQRDILNNTSVLSGDIGIEEDSSDNSYSVVKIERFTDCKLNGFEITNGNADSLQPMNTFNEYNVGGGLYMHNLGSFDDVYIENCVFKDNDGMYGGAIGMAELSLAEVIIGQCLLYNNKATLGGALFVNAESYLGSSKVKIKQSTLNNNDFGTNSISIYGSSDVQLFNSIVWGNIHNNVFYASRSIIKSRGDAYPIFVDTLNDDYNLDDCSPAIDFGDNQIADDFFSKDLNGNPRIYNDGYVDLGVFESQGAVDFATIRDIEVLEMPTCDSTGSLLANISANPPFTLHWNNGDDTTHLIGLEGGKYYLTLSSSNCERQDSLILFTNTNPIIYVDSSATPVWADGCDWATAFSNLQDAIDRVEHGDSIFIAEGTYYPDVGRNVIDDDEHASFGIASSVSLIGGFPSGGGPLHSVNPDFNQTILSGEIQQDTVLTNNTERLVETVRPFWRRDTLNLFGLSFVNCFSETALFFRDGFLRMNGCKFTHNHSLSSTVNLRQAQKSIFENCLFYANSARDCTGITVSRESTIINCSFAGNVPLYQRTQSIRSSFPITINNTILWNENHDDEFMDANYTFNNSIVRNFIDSSALYQYDFLFNDIANGDLELHQNSPGINSGDNAVVSTHFDLLGNKRIARGTVDIGAYEFQYPCFGNIYVDSYAQGNKTGANWTNAYDNLDEGLLQTIDCNQDTIFLARGVYKPSMSRKVDGFIIPDQTVIIGGYSPITGIRNPQQYFSFLDGDIGIPYVNSDNSYHVVTIPNNVQSSELNGVVIRNGNASGDDLYDKTGGGILVNGNLLLIDSRLYNNHAEYEGYGIYISAPSGYLEMFNSRVQGLFSPVSSSLFVEDGATMELESGRVGD